MELRKHSVVVIRWVAEARELRKDDQKYSAELESLDNEPFEKGNQRFRFGKGSRERATKFTSFSWHWKG